MRFITVTESAKRVLFLYELLREREPHQNISHRNMPSFTDHYAFVSSRPYKAWYIIEDDDGEWAGSVYLTRQNEIGIQLSRGRQAAGLGSRALELLMKSHPESRYLANINPENEGSIRFFERHGFKHIQNSYELRP